MDIDVKSLVRHELIDAAAGEYKDACGRLDAARQARDAAATAVADAEARVATVLRAIAAGSADAARADAADAALADAKRSAERAEKVFAAAKAIQEEKLAAEKTAKGAAWVPVMQAAAAEIIAAARDYEAATAAIAAAVERHNRAAAVAFSAHGNGARAPFQNGAELSPIRLHFSDARLTRFNIALKPLAETEALWGEYK